MLKKERINFLKERAKLIRLSILDMIMSSNSSHIGSAFSIIDILTTLFSEFINLDLIKEKSKKRDFFILSKGHSVVALYSILAHVGLISFENLKSYYKDGTLLAGHPIRNSFPGIEASTGSLGHGLPIAVGLALASKKDRLRNKIYVLLGDGECQEGSVWEAIQLAVRLKLNNLIIIVDYNKLQGFDRTENITRVCWKEKFEAFGCNSCVIDGHNFLELIKTFNDVKQSDYPKVIIANTIKGKGISFMEDKLEWHYKSPNSAEYDIAKKEIL